MGHVNGHGRNVFKTSKDTVRSRDAWQGEGGNPRTGQRAQIIEYDNTTKTRHVLDLHEKEQHARDEVTYRPDGVANRLDPLQQMGRWMEPALFIAKLRLSNPNLICEDTIKNPGFMGIYVECDGLNIKTGESGRYKRYITSFCSTAPLPEFSIMGARMEERPKADGTLTNSMKHAYEKTRGWRTVLAKLYSAGLITEAHIVKHFRPELGRSSELWQKHVHQPIQIGVH